MHKASYAVLMAKGTVYPVRVPNRPVPFGDRPDRGSDRSRLGPDRPVPLDGRRGIGVTASQPQADDLGYRPPLIACCADLARNPLRVM